MKTDQAQIDTVLKSNSGAGIVSPGTPISRRRRQTSMRDLAGNIAAFPETEPRAISSGAPSSVIAATSPHK